MKRFLLILLVLLFLSGCGNQNQQVPTTVPETEPSEPSGTYVENSTIEQQLQGAVRVYDLGKNVYDGLALAGDKLLLSASGEQTTLCVLEGERGVISAETKLNINVRDAAFQTIPAGAVYYDQKSNCAVYLDMQLQEAQRVSMPEDMQGAPVFSWDGREIFYCVGQEIRSLDTQQGISRLIKSHTCNSQKLLGSYFDGKMLVCCVENGEGETTTRYISSETGRTLRADNVPLQLYTYKDAYFGVRMDGIVEQRLFGLFTEQPGQQLNVWEGQAVPALELNGIICYNQAEELGLQLDFYDLASGKKTSSVTIPTSQVPISFQADQRSGVWILTGTEASQELLHWDVKQTLLEDEQDYTSSAYTGETPDETGLALCKDRAEDLEAKHGVAIRLWKSAGETTGGYSIEPEHQTQAINRCLDQLDAVMSELPVDFLYKSVSTRIRICVVRSVANQQKAVQFWHDGSAYILMPSGADVRETFLNCLGYIVDSHVLGNSPNYDYWNDLNPEGFVYGDETTYSDTYLSGETMAFVDENSMGSVTEDRCRIFFEAMKTDNADAFRSEIMQQKLLMLCKAIRDAWRWERKSEIYPWEQYLTESIAYVR